ncbi:hypothetical protein SB717_21695 [Priestia sp. SIMBA_032]|uniref:hypothetical protein n=1 Tax=Priestia sp. SIMBA_032 TaxID=3085775 RepID=UPI00397D4839
MTKFLNVESSILVERDWVQDEYASMIRELEKSILDKDEHNAMKQFGIFVILNRLLYGDIGGDRYNSIVRMINKAFKCNYAEHELD